MWFQDKLRLRYLIHFPDKCTVIYIAKERGFFYYEEFMPSEYK